MTRLRRWWAKKYNRPPTDPMFTGQTVAELELEMFEDLLLQREEIMEKLDEHGHDQRERGELRERLAEINEVFEIETDLGEDSLIDEWERQIAEGEVPDLSKTTVG